MPTTIEWTQRPGTKGETWNPTTGCNKVSAGCKNCYAEKMHKRLRAMHQPKYARAFTDGVVTHADTLAIPLKWKKPRTVFVNSMSDLFHADVPFEFIDQVFAVMALCPQHTFQILTKRPERMAEYLCTGDGKYDNRHCVIQTTVDNSEGWDDSPIPDDVHAPLIRNWPLPNVWLGTSVENQETANARIPHLLRCPAAVRFLSCEPLLGQVKIRYGFYHQPPDELTASGPKKVYGAGGNSIHWVITGGESGPKARPIHPDWARSLRDQCAASNVPFFFKQWGNWIPVKKEGIHPEWLGHKQYKHFPDGQSMTNVGKHAAGNMLDGGFHNAYPNPTT